MTNKVTAVLFDLDNTLINTTALAQYRDSINKPQLTEAQLAQTKIYPKTKGILEFLDTQKIKLGLVTNSPRRYAHSVLKHHGIYDFFSSIITYDDVTSSGVKPSPKGIELALAAMGINNDHNVLFIGDHEVDMNAAYAAGVKPIFPAWATKDFIRQIPASMLSTQCLKDEINSFDQIDLIADRCANFNTFDVQKKWNYFIPMNSNGYMGAIRKDDIEIICLGRYFSQKNILTAKLHENHRLSKEIFKKETDPKYVAPEYWVELINHFVNNIPEYLLPTEKTFDIVTVIPAKKGKNKRLENLLGRISKRNNNKAISFIPDLFYFTDDAVSLKSLHGKDSRVEEIKKSLKLSEKYNTTIKNKNILIVDDVITTGATLSGAVKILSEKNTGRVIGLTLAKTVSISEDAQICDKCGRVMRVRRNTKHGHHFLACSGFHETPQCKNINNIIIKQCPKCGSGMYKRPNYKGTLFLACEGYYNEAIKCKHAENIE